MELKRLNSDLAYAQGGLLIVPYGIETSQSEYYAGKLNAFNRTLWN